MFLLLISLMLIQEVAEPIAGLATFLSQLFKKLAMRLPFPSTLRFIFLGYERGV